MISCAASFVVTVMRKGVQKDSQTETFAALRLNINSWRWKGVPFYVRAGKCLPVTCTEIVGRFRKPPTLMPEAILKENYLRLRLSPEAPGVPWTAARPKRSRYSPLRPRTTGARTW